MFGCQKVIEYQIQTFIYLDIVSTSNKKWQKYWNWVLQRNINWICSELIKKVSSQKFSLQLFEELKVFQRRPSLSGNFCGRVMMAFLSSIVFPAANWGNCSLPFWCQWPYWTMPKDTFQQIPISEFWKSFNVLVQLFKTFRLIKSTHLIYHKQVITMR